MKWIALAFVVLYVGAIVIGKLVTAAFDYFQVDGNHSAGACPLTKGGTRPETPVSTLTTVGGPFAVDASNGPLPDFPFTPLAQGDTGCPPILLLGMRNEPVFLDPTTDSERMKLSGLVEVHKLPEGIVPPPSRSIRRSIH